MASDLMTRSALPLLLLLLLEDLALLQLTPYGTIILRVP
jgi:hypothetical protein